MSAEYNGKLDEDKTVPVLPRPLVDGNKRIRALNLTGSPTGSMPTDDQQWWRGLAWQEGVRLATEFEARLERLEAYDAAWYD